MLRFADIVFPIVALATSAVHAAPIPDAEKSAPARRWVVIPHTSGAKIDVLSIKRGLSIPPGGYRQKDDISPDTSVDIMIGKRIYAGQLFFCSDKIRYTGPSVIGSLSVDNKKAIDRRVIVNFEPIRKFTCSCTNKSLHVLK